MSVAAFQRPPFVADGRVVARRELRIGERTYAGGEELSAADRAELSERQVGTFWSQGLIDTLPPAPAAPPPPKQHHQHRR